MCQNQRDWSWTKWLLPSHPRVQAKFFGWSNSDSQLITRVYNKKYFECSTSRSEYVGAGSLSVQRREEVWCAPNDLRWGKRMLPPRPKEPTRTSRSMLWLHLWPALRHHSEVQHLWQQLSVECLMQAHTAAFFEMNWPLFMPRDSECIERVQRKALRFIYNAYGRTDSVTELLNRSGLPTLKSRRKLHRL